ncbi:MAG TPA: DUF11 domain-containing protein, partial [Planctomycetes bacterium]|nr:DUF11 domain-containing protein [Planctomycetota bacterium]
GMPAQRHVPGPFSPDPRLPTASLPVPGQPVQSREQQAVSQLAASPLAPGLAGAEGTGTPGSVTLEGAQSPQLTIQKFAPAGIQVGRTATFRIVVRNTGQTPAQDVQVQDEIPKGTRLVATEPLASRGVSGQLVWKLGTMNPGDEATLEVELMPLEEGEIGSVATVHFGAAASAKSVATKPELVVETSAPRQVLIGEEVVLKITLSNPGSGTATGVVLEEHVPAALQHPAGSELEYEVGDLGPNESRQIELRLRAERPGQATNVLIARADGNLKVEDRVDLEVLAPQLAVHVEGPKRRYLEREATYIFSVENPGTAPAKNVDLVVYLPPGFQFLRANNSGYYDESNHTVRWRLAELPAAEKGSVQLTAVPSQPGEHSLRFVGSTPSGLSAEERQTVRVEGIAALLFEVVDVIDPIEAGGQTTYEIRVVNQGSKAATNVRLAVLLPPQLRAVAAEGPPGIQYKVDGNKVTFDPLGRLAPKADTTYRVRVQGLEPGDLRTTVQLMADQLQDWVTKQESTRVYADE